jgi:hypothetical protein
MESGLLDGDKGGRVVFPGVHTIFEGLGGVNWPPSPGVFGKDNLIANFGFDKVRARFLFAMPVVLVVPPRTPLATLSSPFPPSTSLLMTV